MMPNTVQQLHKIVTQRLEFPTRVTGTTTMLIDHVLYNERVNSVECCISFPSITDHYAIYISFDFSKKNEDKNVTISRYPFLNN